jgi:outer membrane immunogenic protein
MILSKFIRTGVAAFGALAALSVTQANAADIYPGGGGYKDIPPPQPCCSFTGFYIGANMGMAFSEVERRGGPFTDAFGTINIPNDKINSTNGFGGGQFGYNFQSSCCWLYGIEVDVGALALNRSFHRFNQMSDPRILGVEFDGDRNNNARFAGDVTGRIGYTFGNSLVYVKGGFAFVDVGNRLNETIFFTNGTSATFGNNNNDNNDNFRTGWTVGAGYEWKPCCQSNWSIKIEYLHFDFSHDNNDFIVDSEGNRFRNGLDVRADTVKIGFNYFWNAPAVPLK